MTINTLAALAWGLLTVNTQTGEYTVIRGIDSQAQYARARTYGFCPIRLRVEDPTHAILSWKPWRGGAGRAARQTSPTATGTVSSDNVKPRLCGRRHTGRDPGAVGLRPHHCPSTS